MCGIWVCRFVLNVRDFCFFVLFLSLMVRSWLRPNAFVVLQFSLSGASGSVHNWVVWRCLIYSCSMMIWGISQIHGASSLSDPISFLRLSSFPKHMAVGKLEPQAVGLLLFCWASFQNCVGTCVFTEEGESLILVSVFKQWGRLHLQHVAVWAFIPSEIQSLLHGCFWLVSPAFLWFEAHFLFSISFLVDTRLSDDILLIFFLKLNFKL